MKLGAFYKSLKTRLEQGGEVENPGLEARLIVKQVTSFTESDLIASPDAEIPPESEKNAARIVARRLEGEPISRIFGEREFWGLRFAVTPDVLDPRPDTETLVDAALGLFRDCPPARILDLGTGSGAIIVALLHEFPAARGVAVDVSEKALAVARRNAEQNGVLDRLALRHGNWFDAVPEGATFDLIVSNPPYIPNPDLETLEKGVRNHDPILALDGGFDGFDSYKAIFSGLESRFSVNGAALFEIGIGQAPDIERLAGNAGLRMIRLYLDLSGIPRVLQIGRGDK
jgi:release factor glutamine methyltransferase